MDSAAQESVGTPAPDRPAELAGMDWGGSHTRRARRSAEAQAMLSAAKRRGWADVVAVAVLAAAIVAWCWPAFVHGWVYGSFDQALNLGIGAGTFSGPVHNYLSGDQTLQDAAWLFLNYRDIHHGLFPLWNPYNALGAPQFADFQSGVLSLPSLVAYLVPLPVAYTVQVLVKLLLAGTGAYFAARVIGCRPTSALIAGLVGELAGPLAAWAGWPQDSVAAWTGWMIGSTVLLFRTRRRWPAALLAVSVAFSIYGGLPDLLVLVVGALVCFVVVLAFAERNFRQVRSWVRFVLAVGSGFGLAAPLLVPGVTVERRGLAWGRLVGDMPAHMVLAILTNGYYGYPLTGSSWFGFSNYYETAAYVGPVVLGLAACALGAWRAKREVVGLAVTSVVLAATTWGANTLDPLLHRLPGLRSVILSRGVIPLVIVLGLLAAIGLEVLIGTGMKLKATRILGWGGLGLLGAITVGLAIYASRSPLPSAERSIRLHSLIWPGGLLVALAAFYLIAGTAGERTRAQAAGLLVGLQAAFLAVVGAPLNTWGNRYYPADHAVKELKAIVGSSLVATGGLHPVQTFVPAAFYPNSNIPYGIYEFALYDADTPTSLFAAWVNHCVGCNPQVIALAPNNPQFEPAVNSDTQARQFGVRYILTPPGTPPLPKSSGLKLVAKLAGEDLYLAPGSSRASFVAATDSVTSGLSFNGDNTARLSVSAPEGSWLHLEVTQTPGWSAEANGHPVPVRTWDEGMIQVWVPKGTHEVVIHYWPHGITVGLRYLLAGVVVLAGLLALPRRRRRARHPLFEAWATASSPEVEELEAAE